jgi:hypothetical protein
MSRDRGGNITYPTTQDLIRSAIAQSERANQKKAAAIGGYGDLTVIGPWPVGIIEVIKGKAFIQVKCAVPAGIVKIKVVLEQYTGASDPRTVVRRISDTDKEVPSEIATQGGLYTFRFDIGLAFNASYGCPKLVAFMSDGTIVSNPVTDVPITPRILADYFVDSLFTLGDPFGVPSSPDANLILVNRRDLTTKDVTDAELVVRVLAPLTSGGAPQSWGAAGITEVIPVFQRTNGTPNPYPVDKTTVHVLQGTDLTQVLPSGPSINRGYIDIMKKGLAAGAPYNWIANIAWAGEEKVVSTGPAVGFTGAAETTDPSVLAGSLSLTITNATEPFDAGGVKVALNYTQPANVVSLKNVKGEIKLQAEADSAYNTRIDKFSLKDDTYNTVGAHTGVVISENMKTKASRSYRLRITITAIGGSQVQFEQNFATGADGAVLQDTAVPTLATNPDTGTTGPTVKERHSKLKYSCPTPSANINTLYEFQVVLQTVSTEPSATPSIGSGGVVDIAYGQSGTFNISYLLPLTGDLWVCFRARNQFTTNNGYSAWSARTNQDGYSRPLQDFIGDAVPDNSEGLIRIGTLTGVSSTVVDLGAGASSVDDFYNDNAIHIDSPGTPSPNADTWRKITDYNGITKQATLDVALSGTPGGGIFYDIHAIDVPGDKAGRSGTGHTTSTFILGSDASSVDDFFNGYTIYIPTLPAADRIRKVRDYVGATRTITVEVNFSVAPSSNLGYLLVNGSIGFSSAPNADTLTGVASPVPFRWYLNSSKNLVYEVLPPIGENAFSLTHFQITNRRRGGNQLKDDSGALAIVSGLGYTIPAAPFGTFWASSIRFRNMFREGGSDGWGTQSYWVAVLSEPDSANYDPDIFGGAVVVDYQDEDAYPRSRYPIY